MIRLWLYIGYTIEYTCKILNEAKEFEEKDTNIWAENNINIDRSSHTKNVTIISREDGFSVPEYIIKTRIPSKPRKLKGLWIYISYKLITISLKIKVSS